MNTYTVWFSPASFLTVKADFYQSRANDVIFYTGSPDDYKEIAHFRDFLGVWVGDCVTSG